MTRAATVLRRFVFLAVVCHCTKSGDHQQSALNGGWRLHDEKPVKDNGRCTVERRDGRTLTQEEFAYNKPVIIDHLDNAAFAAATRRASMESEWGGVDVVLNSANTHSYTRVPTTFGKYLDEHLKPQSLDTMGNETLLLFGDIDPTTWRPLLTLYNQPHWRVPGMEPALSFGIAAAGTGVPFHFHGPGFAEVIHGGKRWFLTPFDEKPAFNPDKSTLDWYLNEYPQLAEHELPLECLMLPGEIIYFPDKWYHATLNMETSVFISTFLSATSPNRPKSEL